ncbi:MAG: DUF2169 domain-containing protein [Gammaproteobacteria bacterium]|nr:DUF2169 domain-containing protein [Gammaproteobacteria bacterium]MDH5802372.1 DUF2169 domain-containing protein [Gammaproteobacteria bacterium]
MLDNQTPFEAERTWVRDKNGVHHWIVIVKATYDIDNNGTLSLSEEPMEPLHAAEYIGDDGESSIRYEADMVAMKPGTDIYLNAVAYAPNEKPCTELGVAFKINNFQKVLKVTGKRYWDGAFGGRIQRSDPEPFISMPIVYESAYGGFDQKDPNPSNHRIDFRNPIGSGFAYHPNNIIGTPAPNIEAMNQDLGKGNPAGFGAIAGFWSPRNQYAGTYDDNWTKTRKPLLPLDYDPRFLMCAPSDQQTQGYLAGGEQVELVNLTPNNRMNFTLPKHSFQFETYFGAQCKLHHSQLVSVVIESEGPRLIMVWQTSLQVGNDGDYLDKTVITQTGSIQ